MKHNINHADIKDWASNYKGELFDGILCDPPYELGFMGKSWDSTGIAYDKEMWQDIFKLLKPGGHLLAFSGSRTYHRMAVAIEDAGFEIRDMIEWVYGSGFPKSLNIGKAVDKIQGNERVPTGEVKHHAQKGVAVAEQRGAVGGGAFGQAKSEEVTKGNSPFEGYGTALKPAHEPCVLARKPIEGTVANNVLKHGTGGLNIDGSRVAGDMGADRALGKPRIDTDKYGKANSTLNPQSPLGRFPANLIHDGSDEVVGLFPDTKSNRHSRPRGGESFRYANESDNQEYYTDSGSAARFFYTAKASKSERNAGLEGFEPQITNDGREKDIDNAFQRGMTLRTNHHPTVKPLSLTKYLATLIKPPTGGRLLVPFSGSGSEMIGALQAGWDYVEGVELTEEYIPIAEARIKYWVSKPQQESML
jgi:site-specific DNA-methyltransferase (adenine-specific)